MTWLRALCLGHLDHQPVADVVADRQVWEERVVLEYGVHIAVERRDAGHVATCSRGDPAIGGAARSRRSSAARGCVPEPGRSEHREELAIAHIQVDAVDSTDIPVLLRDSLESHGRDRVGGT